MRAAAAARPPILESRGSPTHTNEPPPPPCNSLCLDHSPTGDVLSGISKANPSFTTNDSPLPIPPTLSDLERGVHVGSADIERTDPSLECASGAGHKNTARNNNNKKKPEAAWRLREKERIGLTAFAAQDAADVASTAGDLAELLLEEMDGQAAAEAANGAGRGVGEV